MTDEVEVRIEDPDDDSRSRWRKVLTRVKAVKTFEKGGQVAKARRELGVFFGVTRDPDNAEDEKWNQRRLRMIARKFGNVRGELLEKVGPADDEVDIGVSGTTTPHVQRCLSNVLRQPSRGAVQLEKRHALTTIGASVKWKLTAMKNRRRAKGDQTDGAVEQMELMRRDQAAPLGLRPSTYRDEEGPSAGDILHPKDLLRVAGTPKPQKRRFRLRLGIFGRIFGCLPRRDPDTKNILKEMDRMPEYRPYFTYWVTFVQVVVFLIAICGYGIAPIGLKVVTKFEDELLRSSNALEKVCWFEYDNLWIGPRQADLIRLGARYSPCMRYDKNLQNGIILPDRKAERESACCIRNDGSGCYQSSKAECSQTLSTWLKWPEAPGADSTDGVNRTSGSVCGLDPTFCAKPQSVQPFAWPDDVTKWPRCQASKISDVGNSKHSSHPHMTCEVTGRPCCVGIKGECFITSREHCAFMRGYYHQNASLCSQVNCLNEICGLLPFIFSGGDYQTPDQFYRLFLSIFLHAGVIHLLLSLPIQLIFMSDLEKMSGWHRTSIIYILSGFLGNLTSAIFLPYQVEAGPTGCHFGLLAMTVVEFINAWRVIKNPWHALLKYSAFSVVALLIGLFPWVDNYSHIAGFFSGLFLSYVLLPYTSIGGNNVRMRILSIALFSMLWLGSAITLLLFFYLWPIVNCPGCKYINCIPLTPNFCDNMDVNITARTRCVS